MNRTNKTFIALVLFFAFSPVHLCAGELLSQGEHKALIDQGISHLASLQKKAGNWNDDSYPTAMTALSGLAILGGGYGPRRGSYQKTLTQTIDQLLDSQRADGWISMGDQRSMYGHGYATLFLTQIYGETYDNRIRLALQKAIDFIVAHQSQRGGWNYEPNGGDEGSVTIVQIQALRAARNIGISVPKEAIQKSIDYIKSSQREDGSIAYSPGPSGNGTVALTAQGMSVLFHAGKYDMDEIKQKGFSYLDRNLTFEPNGGHFLYTHFYAAQVQKQRALSQAHAELKRLAKNYLVTEGTPGEISKGIYERNERIYFWKYYRRIENTLAPLLGRSIRDKEYNLENGHIYTVAMMLLILETRMNYLPIFQD